MKTIENNRWLYLITHTHTHQRVADKTKSWSVFKHTVGQQGKLNLNRFSLILDKGPFFFYILLTRVFDRHIPMIICQLVLHHTRPVGPR